MNDFKTSLIPLEDLLVFLNFHSPGPGAPVGYVHNIKRDNILNQTYQAQNSSSARKLMVMEEIKDDPQDGHRFSWITSVCLLFYLWQQVSSKSLNTVRVFAVLQWYQLLVIFVPFVLILLPMVQLVKQLVQMVKMIIPLVLMVQMLPTNGPIGSTRSIAAVLLLVLVLASNKEHQTAVCKSS